MVTPGTLLSLASFAVLALLWLGFGGALLFDPELLDTIWRSFRGLPIYVQVIVGLLVLPVAVGLWIWETSWPVWLRLLLVSGLAAASLYTFFPRLS